MNLVLSLVHLADHPGDGICAFHLSNSPLARALPADPFVEPGRVADWFRQRVAKMGLGRAVESIADELANELSWWDQHRLKQLVQSAYAFQLTGVNRLSDFERSVEEQRIALPTESQVKVMTVHKSKGLEFDAVFLPDLGAELTARSPLLVLRGDDPTQPPDGVLRYMLEALQKMLPASWQNAFHQTKARSVFESLCLLYVAMTRARSALYMTTRPASGDKARASFESILQSILTQDVALKNRVGEILYSIGDPEWYLHSRRTVMETASEPVPEQRIVLRQDAESAPPRSLRVAAPSTVGQTFEPVPLERAFSFSQNLGISTGTIVHAFFEQVRWLEDYQLDRAELRRIALAAVSPEELRHLNVDQLIDSFAKMLDMRSVRQAISKQRYRKALFGSVAEEVEIDNERAINLVMNDRLISGTIDRLVLLMKDGKPYAAEIIDFKTDAYDADMTLLWVQDRVDHHRPQLEIYAKVVSELFDIPDENIATYLVLLNGDEFVECKRRPGSLVGKPAMARPRASQARIST